MKYYLHIQQEKKLYMRSIYLKDTKENLRFKNYQNHMKRGIRYRREKILEIIEYIICWNTITARVTLKDLRN